MDQEPQQPPSADGQPKLFRNIHGWIAGATGLVVALGGLAATWDRIFPAKPAEPQAAAPVHQTRSGPERLRGVRPRLRAHRRRAPAEAADRRRRAAEAGDPTLYKGELVDGGKVVSIEWDGESWVVTEGDNDPWSYDDTLSPDETRVMAVSNGNYLRWPIAGGEVDESEDKVKWKTYARVDVAEPN